MTNRAALGYVNVNRYVLLFPDDSSNANRRCGVLAHSTSLDFGTRDFAIEFAATWTNTISDQSDKKLIVCNSVSMASLNNTAGWSICLIPSTESIWVGFNDGNASMVSFQWDDVWPATYGANNDQFFRLEFDRSVGCTLYANGVKVSTKTEIAGRQNSIDNAYSLTIGGEIGTATSFLKGSIGLIRLDYGSHSLLDENLVVYRYPWDIKNGATWNKDAYLKYTYQGPFELGHYQNAWEFQNSLTDHVAGFNSPLTFVFYDGSGNPADATYSNNAGNYKFSITFTYDPILYDGHETGCLDLDSRMRGLDGTLKIYKGPIVRYKNWRFRTTSAEQIYVIMGAYYTNSVLTIYDVKSTSTDSYIPHAFRGCMASPPVVRELYRRGDYFDSTTEVQRLWEIDVELVEA